MRLMSRMGFSSNARYNSRGLEKERPKFFNLGHSYGLQSRGGGCDEIFACEGPSHKRKYLETEISQQREKEEGK